MNSSPEPFVPGDLVVCTPSWGRTLADQFVIMYILVVSVDRPADTFVGIFTNLVLDQVLDPQLTQRVSAAPLTLGEMQARSCSAVITSDWREKG